VTTYQLAGWSILGDPTRRTIFERLTKRPSAVGDLAVGLPVSRPAVSQHLKVLKEAGLVVDQQAGNRHDCLQNRRRATRGGDHMTIQAGATSVRHEVVVNVPIERAFSVFTKDFGKFKPPDHNLLEVPIAETVFELHVGGSVFDKGVDGSESHFARVLVYEPPHRVVISWDISPQWVIEMDHTKSSEVEVRFIAEAPDRTRVELEHRNIERHGDGWDSIRDGVDGDNGWPLYLRRYVAYLAT
jgi:DNA-binding transcriptional ArsR family regulator